MVTINIEPLPPHIQELLECAEDYLVAIAKLGEGKVTVTKLKRTHSAERRLRAAIKTAKGTADARP